MSALNPLQLAALAFYIDGEFAYAKTTTEVDAIGDTLLHFIVGEASSATGVEDLQGMLERASTQLDDLRGALAGIPEPGEGKSSIPLADRYAHKVIKTPDDVVSLLITGAREMEDGTVEQVTEHPEFFSVYAQIRQPGGGTATCCVGDFASPRAAHAYALHLTATYKRPDWPVDVRIDLK